jgi:hypothetical protein
VPYVCLHAADLRSLPCTFRCSCLAALGLTLAAIFQAGLAPVAVVVLEWWAALGAALVPLLQAIQSTAAAGPLLWMGDSWRYLGAVSGDRLACPGAALRTSCACLALCCIAVANAATSHHNSICSAASHACLAGAAWAVVREASSGAAAAAAALAGTAKAGQAVGGATSQAMAGQVRCKALHTFMAICLAGLVCGGMWCVAC